MTVLRRYVADRRLSTFWWMIGVLALVAFTAAFFPTVEGDTSFDDVVDDLPESLRTLIGAREGVLLSSAPGYLHARLFSTLLPVVLLIFGIAAGSQAIGGAEEDGTLELLLSNPVTRLRVATERFAATVALLAVMTLSAALALAAIGPPVGLLDDVSTSGLAGAFGALFGLALLHASVAFGAGAAAGRRGVAISAATVLAVAGYLFYGLTAASGSFAAAGWASPWKWYLDRNMLVEGAWAPAIIVPLGASVPVAAAGIAAFLRRDLH